MRDRDSDAPPFPQADSSHFSRDQVLAVVRGEYSEPDGKAVLAELDTLSDHWAFKDNPVKLAQLQLSILKLANGRKEFIVDKAYKDAFPDWRDVIVAAGYG